VEERLQVCVTAWLKPGFAVLKTRFWVAQRFERCDKAVLFL
jgi:hypothetical protein